MLLRNEQQLALNEVETLCMEAADHYAAAAERTADAGLAQLFAELARQRRALAADLGVHIRALDDLPKHPDPDMETVGDLLSGIKALFSGDERKTLIEDRAQFELKVAQAVQSALQQSLSDDAKAVLARIQSHVESARHRLAAALADPS